MPLIKFWRLPGLFAALCLCFSCSENLSKVKDKSVQTGNQQTEQLIGKTLPAWQEGYFDIHAINTGRGESSLYIMPDGTTLLFDAAGSLLPDTVKIPATAPKPNGDISSGQVIVNYVNHFIKPASNEKINYLMISHFHQDHMGDVNSSLPKEPTGDFYLSGITEVGAKKRFEKIIDRGYPDYNYPRDLTSMEIMKNYTRFIDWAKKTYNASAEQLQVGKSDQIVLRRKPDQYPNFFIRNIAGSGKVWSGSGDGYTNHLPSVKEYIEEGGNDNMMSIALEFSYGKFNYFCGGDLQYNDKSTHPWKDMEAPIAKVMSAVDAMKANHHGTAHCNGEELLNKLTPTVALVHPWRDVHPNPETIGRFYAANESCHIFLTNTTEANKVRLKEYLTKIKSLQGHVVLRVLPGGDTYYVYVLDDSNEEYKVNRVFGPYASK